MAFKRTETAAPPMDLTAADAPAVERRILDGVKRYATRTDNWASADRNTPFLGHITGMGIESANLVDITMSIERQFLTRKTARVPAGAEGAFRLEPGPLGKLVILEGEDTTAATPGLAVKMLMDLGHMKRDDAYLAGVVSFAYVVVVGEGYRLHESLRKAIRKVKSAPDAAARAEALANVDALAAQAERYVADLADPAAVAAARRDAYEREKKELDDLDGQYRTVSGELKASAIGEDTGVTDKLRSRQVSLKLRLNAHKLRLRVAEEVAKHQGGRSEVEERKVGEIRAVLAAARDEVAEARASAAAATA